MDNILEIKDLKVWFPIKKGVFARTVGQVKKPKMLRLREMQ